MKLKSIILALVLITSFNVARSQESLFIANWSIAIPVAELVDYTDQPSFGGFNIGGRKFIYDFVSFGGYAGWQLYHDKSTGLHAVKDGLDIWGRKIRHLNIYPIMANVHIYGGQDGGVRPYFGINTGVSIVNENIQIGLWEVSETTGNYTLSPEIGVYIPVGLRGGGLNLSARYDQAFQSSNDYQIQSFIINIGYGVGY
ncbi:MULTISPECIES: hypothetical protein [Reichenbachiella]|uniref:Outer membrane protein beta-barrel domain-containing protein n=1 Tax=Reichenbachiella agariperforans TaxID=156994 RepID=A0A1M6SJV9_REIAG|nr:MULTISPECIES: hypothetical protein [Reichenbachiella]MBU2916166.1 hypothetical protein [Reichenbachiella agariperforans]RJE75020.1 hypothetical protein BGP76_18070 [Reichenbachiella sp. MSK19-1]SHK44983.1 hypothetical protein SAMN04488028_10546 [Reichenbachiella agariperforans]